jgi:hypothetical protein
MKLLFICLFLLMAGTISAQQNFQGTIVYKLHSSKDAKDGELTVMFGLNKIKLKIKEKQEYDKTWLLVDLDSAKIFTLNTDEKNFRSKKLSVARTMQAPSAKTIAGYATTPLSRAGNGSMGLLAGLFSGTTVFYVADDLYYSVPSKFSNTPELMMIQNNHIVLGAEISADNPFLSPENETDTTNQPFITIEAIKVDKNPIDVAEFTIPQSFSKEVPHDWISNDSLAAMDTIMTMTDTTAYKPPVKKPAPKTKPSTPKKTTQQKGEATKKKKTS